MRIVIEYEVRNDSPMNRAVLPSGPGWMLSQKEVEEQAREFLTAWYIASYMQMFRKWGVGQFLCHPVAWRIVEEET